MSAPSRPRSDQSTQLMLEDYNNIREDERHFWAMFPAFLSIGLALLGVLFTLAKDIGGKDPAHYPDALVAMAPMTVIIFLAVVEFFGANAVARSFTMRSLERALRESLPQSDRYITSTSKGRKSTKGSQNATTYLDLPILSAAEIQASHNSMSATRGGSLGLFMLIVGAVTLMSVFGGITVFLSTTVSRSWMVFMWLFYGVLSAILITDALRITRGGRTFFSQLKHRVAERLLQAPDDPVGRADKGRSLASYLVLPRPDELATKSIFTVAGLSLGSMTVASRHPVLVLALLYGTIEFLAYQARYQWNDIRGAEEDAVAPSAKSRGRLPGGRKSVGFSVTGMLVRFGLVVWAAVFLGGALPGDSTLAKSPFISLGLIFGLAILYEIARSYTRSNRCSRASLAVIVLLVSLGYPLRFFLGWLASGASLSTPYLPLSLASLSLLGAMFVGMTWAIESFSYVTRSTGTGQNMRYIAATSILPKDHLRAWANTLGMGITVGEKPARTKTEPVDGPSRTPLRDVALRPLWNVFGAGWILLASLGVYGLISDHNLGWSWWILAGAIVMAWPLKRQPGGGVYRSAAGTFLAMAGTMLLLSSAPDARLWLYLLVLALTLVPFVLLVSFRSLSYESSRNLVSRVLSHIVYLLKLLYRFAIGAPNPAQSAGEKHH